MGEAHVTLWYYQQGVISVRHNNTYADFTSFSAGMWFGILGIHVSGLGLKEGNLTHVHKRNFLLDKLLYSTKNLPHE